MIMVIFSSLQEEAINVFMMSKKDIYLYDDTIRYDKIYIECFIEDNWNTIEEWRNWQGDYHDFPYKFIETL